MSQRTNGFALAAAAAAVFATGAVLSPLAQADEMKDASVHCVGVNSCKGTAECKTAKNECKGQNSRKGQGWVTKASAKDCKDAGGKVAK